MRRHGRWRALLVLALVAAQGCWLQTGFDARRSGFNGGETGITSATVARLAPVWTATVGGAPREAIVFGGTVYARTGGQVTALDTATGAVRWTATGLGGSGQPLVADGRLWVPTQGGHCELDTLDLGTGAVLEHNAIGGPDLNGVGGGGMSSCSVGDALWAGSKVATVWAYVGGAPAPRPCPNLFVFATGRGFAGVDIDGHNGDFANGGLTQSCDAPTTFPALPGPLTSDETSIFANEASGATGYSVTCAGSCVATFAWQSGATIVPVVVPLAGGAEAAAVRPDGHVAVVDAHTGAVHWTGTLGATASLPPAVTDTTIFGLAGDGTLSAFPVGGCGAAACPADWTATLPAAATGRPSIVGDVLYVGSSDGTLSAFAAGGCGAATCSPLFTATVPGSVSDSPVVDGGVLYVGSTTGTVTAYKVAS